MLRHLVISLYFCHSVLAVAVLGVTVVLEAAAGVGDVAGVVVSVLAV